jgi:hypothetical protein
LPGIPTDYGYGIQQTGPSRFATESPSHTERHNISQLPDSKWLYHDQNHADNNADFIHILPRGGCLSAFHDRHTGKQNCVQLPLYEDIIADPESGIREILQFINWEYDPFGHGKWESYAGHLAPLLAALG